MRYTYVLPRVGTPPYRVTARLLFRAFPPYLIRAFAEYEALQAARGLRPGGSLVSARTLERLDIVELAQRSASFGP